MQALIDFFGIKGLIPHGYCLSWSPLLLWLNVISDLLITLAYYSIPLILIHLLKKRKDVPYPWLLVMFAGFIVACGTTHLLSAVTVWIPLYWLDGLFKVLTAVLSIATAMLMLWIVPKVLFLPSATQLQAEIQRRKTVEEALRIANAELQRNVARTQSLFDSALDGIITIDHDGNVTGWNSQAEQIFGYSCGQALGCQITELIIPPAYQESHRQSLSRFMETGVSAIIGTRLEVTAIRADGTEFPIELAVDALGEKDDYFFSAYVRDISARKQAETAKQEALDKLHKIAAQLPGVVFQFRLRSDGSSCLPYASDVLRDIYRIDPEDVIEDAAKVFAVVHPDDLEQHLASIRASAHDLSPWRNEYRLRHSDGTECWLFGNALPQREEDGSVLWHGFVTDITERRMIEEAVRESENKLATILDNVDAYIYIKDCNYQYQYGNKALRQLFGRPLEEIIGKFDNAFFDETTSARLRQNDIRVIELGESIASENIYNQKNTGTTCTYFTAKQPLRREDGSIYGLCGISTDITERKVMENELIASEAKFRSIIEVSPIPMAMNDEQLNITFLNSAFVQTFGYTREDLPSLPDWWLKAYPDPDYRHWVQTTWQETLEKAKQEQTDFPPMEVAICCKDNSIRIVLATAVTIQHDFVGMNLAILYDITQRKQVENELTRSNAELEQFAYAVSHDMRQPLRMVTSYLSLIESALGGRLDEETQQFLDFAVDGAKRMDAMILSLLDYSRVGRKTEAKTRISSKISLDEALAFLGPEINSYGCEIKVSGDWPELFASRDELTRLLQNLIGNALKYHEENQPPQIHVHGEVCAGSLRVEVRDQGIGIEPKQMDRLFKVFSRLQARSRFEGTGVGLALCRKIVEHHHGTIGVESAGEGQGCTFWFELPLLKRS